MTGDVTGLDGFNDKDGLAVRLRAGPDLDYAQHPALPQRNDGAGVPRRDGGLERRRLGG